MAAEEGPACESLGTKSEEVDQPLWLIYGGKTGWIGRKLMHLCAEGGRCTPVAAQARMEKAADVEAELASAPFERVIIAAGLTGRPNVDWCEDHKQEVLKVNVQGVLNVLQAAHERGVHCTYFGTGCIYTYDAQHPQATGKGFTEADSPNFRGSWYSHTKAMVEEALPAFPNTLTLRLRMPLSDDLHPRSLLTKLTKYEKVVNIPNSVSVLHDLLPVAVHLVQQGSTGTFNFTNPGTVTHNFILQQYQEVVDPAFTWTNFSEEEQSRILKAPRSNTELDVTKLLCAAKPLTIPPADESVKSLMHRLRLNV